MMLICKRSCLFFVVLILIFSFVLNSTNSFRKNQVQTKTEWGDSSNCYAYDNFTTDGMIKQSANWEFLAQNKYTKKYVYVRTYLTKQEGDTLEQNKYPNNYKYHSQSKVHEDYFPSDSSWNYKLRNRTFYFTWVYKTCKEARNEGAQPDPGFKEIVDKDLSFLSYKKCNYICRTVYMAEKGRCEEFFSWRIRGHDIYRYRCTYLIPSS